MSLVHEIDYGTPASKGTDQVTLTIDGQAVTVPAGTSIMRAAMDAGTQIPKLCATDSVDAFGSCRLCLVEIQGRPGTPASCTTPVASGMVVSTQTERLKQIRKGVMELYISDHPLDCLTCAANGDCELQDMAGAVGLRDVRYGYDGESHTRQEKDESNPYFTFDPSKCIVCSRCVRACQEVQGTFALTIDERGFASHVSAGMNEDFLDSECVSCGACVQACPTATLSEKSVIEIGTPEHSVVTTCAYCGVGCSFKAEMRGEELVRMVPYKDGQANRGHSCVKGRFAWGYANHKERILNPMIRESIDQPWREVSWDEAIAYTASEFKRIQAKYGRGAIGGITSSRCTNEENFVMQKLMRAAIGTHNVDNCSRVCHSPSSFGLIQGLGLSGATGTFDDIEAAKAVHRRTLTHYALLPNYRNYWKEAGYVEEMNAIEKALAEGRRDDVPKFLTDRWLADNTLFGPAAKVREGVAAWREAGVHTPILVPSSAAGNQMKALEEVFAAFS